MQAVQLPFTAEQFFSTMARYNDAVWPLQLPLGVLPLAALVLALVRCSWSGAVIGLILAFLWTWVGIAYHLLFFTAINRLAYAFAALFIAGGIVFAWQGAFRRALAFRVRRTVRSAVGLVLVFFALVVYPVWASFAGHGYPELPTFGLPCPTTIFTIGLLCLAEGPGLRPALIGPASWAFVGGQAAFLLTVPPDLGLLAAGFVAIALFILPQTRKAPAS